LKIVRWIWAVVVACLVAAAPVRPAPARDSREVAIEAAAKALPVATHRRDGAHAPELRLVAIAPAIVALVEPPMVFALDVERAKPAAPQRSWSASRSARGPPVALAS
jgi:hypothetical protein